MWRPVSRINFVRHPAHPGCEQCGDCLDCDNPHECYFTSPTFAVNRALDRIGTKMLSESVSLDSESARILYANLWDLYI